jgi:hypothetical protein
VRGLGGEPQVIAPERSDGREKVASRHAFFSHLLRFLRIFLVLPLIGAAHVLMRDTLTSLSFSKTRLAEQVQVLVLFLLEFAKDALC